MDDASGGVMHRIGELEELVEVQRELIDRLQRRVDDLDQRSTSAPAPAALDGDAVRRPDLGATTSRRSLLTKSTAAAAGAALIGTAASVAAAPPAAAASGSFDGNPAVLGVANPTTGTGIRGTTVSGTGVWGSATGVSGNTIGVLGSTSSGAGTGVRGESSLSTGSTRGVVGYVASSEGTAVSGTAGAGSGATRGVLGMVFSPSGTGVEGSALTATGATTGVRGTVASAAGVGVQGEALTGIALRGESGRTQIAFGGAPVPPLAAGLSRNRGEMAFDSFNDLWLCVGTGTPGTWRRIAGPTTAGALRMLTNTTRIYDSRAGEAPVGVQKGKFVDHEERVITATLGGAVPAGATAVLINATATNTNPGGFFAFFRNGVAWPSNSSLSWGVANTTIANLAVVAVDATAKFKARVEGAGGADLVIDCIGYYQ